MESSLSLAGKGSLFNLHRPGYHIAGMAGISRNFLHTIFRWIGICRWKVLPHEAKPVPISVALLILIIFSIFIKLSYIIPDFVLQMCRSVEEVLLKSKIKGRSFVGVKNKG